MEVILKNDIRHSFLYKVVLIPQYNLKLKRYQSPAALLFSYFLINNLLALSFWSFLCSILKPQIWDHYLFTFWCSVAQRSDFECPSLWFLKTSKPCSPSAPKRNSICTCIQSLNFVYKNCLSFLWECLPW